MTRLIGRTAMVLTLLAAGGSAPQVSADQSAYFYNPTPPRLGINFQFVQWPVRGYYVQYVHARISSIIRLAKERQLDLDGPENLDLKRLNLSEEMALIKQLSLYPEVVENSARFLEPHRLPYYLTELASAFHSYYKHHRIIQDDLGLAQARYHLVKAIRVVVGNGLGLLGVSAPEQM